MRGVVPVHAQPDGHVERYVERVGRAHLLPDDLLDGVALAGSDLQHQLVMDLQQQAGPQALLGQGGVGAPSIATLMMSAGAALDGARSGPSARPSPGAAGCHW